MTHALLTTAQLAVFGVFWFVALAGVIAAIKRSAR